MLLRRRMLTVSDVSVRFRGLQALSGVSFVIEPGELVALIGPNGAGKSTLINVMSGALYPTAGKVTFNGQTISGLPAHTVARSGLVRTFQALELFGSLTVIQNVMVGGVPGACGFWRNLTAIPEFDRTAQHLRDAAVNALEMVGLAHRMSDIAGTLPAGERRLLAIARALVTGAAWLVLDEPGAGLNEAEKRRLAETVRTLAAQGKTILFVEHDMTFVASVARRLLVLDRGMLIADGEPDAVRADARVLSAYLGVPAQLTERKRSATDRPAPLLRAAALSVSYGDLKALRGVSLTVGSGELVAVVGANGAGKSTLLKTLAGVLNPAGGTVELDGKRRHGRPLIGSGVALVPEGRELFVSLSVEDNLLLGYWSRAGWLEHWMPMRQVVARRGREGLLDEIYGLFPRLSERRHQLAGSLSGGEGQMLAIGRALMSRPRMLLLDEPSLGLAPLVTAEILDMLTILRARGLGVLLVEQNATAALMIADYGYVLEDGHVQAEGPGPSLLESGRLAEMYLGKTARADERTADFIT
jgi:branched-chain amino acid transport system ATP-binding protein